MKKRDELLIDVLDALLPPSQPGYSSAAKIALNCFQAHLEAEGAPGPLCSKRIWTVGPAQRCLLASGHDGECDMETKDQAPPVQPAPPGFRVVGRSGHRFTPRLGQWVQFAYGSDGVPVPGPPHDLPFQWRDDEPGSQKQWDSGCFLRLEPIDQPAAPPTSGAGDAYRDPHCIMCRSPTLRCKLKAYHDDDCQYDDLRELQDLKRAAPVHPEQPDAAEPGGTK